MHAAPTLPPDLTIAWTPDGIFARLSADEETPVPTVWWFLAAVWAWLGAIPIGMAVGSSLVTLLVAAFAVLATFRARAAAPRAFDIHGDALTLRGFARRRIPLHRIDRAWLEGERLVLELEDGESYWLCVEHWSRRARVWGLAVIEEAVARGHRLHELDAPVEEQARTSLAALRSRHRASKLRS